MKRKKKLKYHFFISFSNSDKEKAEKLFDVLDKHYQVFFSPNSVDIGDEWDLKIKKAQLESLTTLILYSKDTSMAFYQREEITRAISYHRQNFLNIIPIQLDRDAEIPFGLTNIQRINFEIVNNKNELIALLDKHLIKNKSDSYGLKRKKEGLNPVFSTLYEYEIMWYHMPFDRDKRLKQIYIEQKINKYLASIPQASKLQIIYLDIDDFEKLNRKYNQDFGNELLKRINEMLDENNPDFLTRLVGDEFLIIYSNNVFNDVYGIAEKIYNSITNFNWTLLANNLYVDVSIGIAETENKIEKLDLSNKEIRRTIMKAIYGCKISKKNNETKVNYGPIFIDEREFSSLQPIWNSGS